MNDDIRHLTSLIVNFFIDRLGVHINTIVNFRDITLSLYRLYRLYKLDTRSKISTFIGYVNKVKANFGHLQMYVLCK